MGRHIVGQSFIVDHQCSHGVYILYSLPIVVTQRFVKTAGVILVYRNDVKSTF